MDLSSSEMCFILNLHHSEITINNIQCVSFIAPFVRRTWLTIIRNTLYNIRIRLGTQTSYAVVRNRKELAAS